MQSYIHVSQFVDKFDCLHKHIQAVSAIPMQTIHTHVHINAAQVIRIYISLQELDPDICTVICVCRDYVRILQSYFLAELDF